MGYKDRTEIILASDRVQWQVSVNTIINLGFIQNKEFLGWQTNLQLYTGQRRNKLVEIKEPPGNGFLCEYSHYGYEQNKILTTVC
jgi:hypothetical protein